MADPPTPEFTEEHLKKLRTYASGLPYSIEPNSEIQKLLDFYLTRITQCVIAKDYDPGLLQWDSMLNYWRMLKYPIPKEKRISIAKVYFNICVTPGMPLHVVGTCLETLNALIRSKKKLTVDDMRLPWKPIYRILSKDLFLTRRQFEITQTTHQMGSLAEVSRRFFHPACAEEMLETMLPELNGTDVNSVLSIQYYLTTFLPLSHPTWLPMMMRLWASINSYMFDERHFAILSQLAEMHIDPTVSDPARLDEIPDDARIDETGNIETEPRLRWNREGTPVVNKPNGLKHKPQDRRKLGIHDCFGGPEVKPTHDKEPWRGIYKDIGIFTQEEWDLIMCKCLASMGGWLKVALRIGRPLTPFAVAEIPLADGGSLTTGPTVDEQATFEFSRLPKSTWRIYSLAKLIVYSMAPDGNPLPHSGTATPFEIPIANEGGYFARPVQPEKSYLAGCKALDSLAKLIVSLESFFHPSNSGTWTTDLSAFLKYVVFEFNKRWYQEMEEDCKVPRDRRLNRQMRRELVRSLRTPAFLAMFSTDSETVSNIQSALKSMTIMEPDLIVPPILERAIPSLEALVETQRTLAVIKALGAIALGIVSRDLFHAGAKHLVHILELLLPGIDLNDPMKTICTTAFLVEISQHIRFSDLTQIEPSAVSSDAAHAPWSAPIAADASLPTLQFDLLPEPQEDSRPCLSEVDEDALVKESTCGFANWVASFIRRVIVLLENLPDEDPSVGSNGGGTESSVVNSVVEACSQICAHLSDPLFDLALDLIYNFATTTVRSNAVRAIHQLVGCIASANPQKTMARFIPFCIKSIRTELDHGASSIRSTTFTHSQPSDATLHWNIAIIRGACKDGNSVLQYQEQLISLLQLLHVKTLSKRGFSYTGKLLYSLLATLTDIYPVESRFVNPDQWDSPSFRENHHKYWGKLYAIDDVKVQWHVPNNNEVGFALELLEKLVEPALSTLESLISVDSRRDAVWGNDFCRNLSLVRNAFSGIPSLRKEFISPEETAEGCKTSDVLNELPEFIASVAPIQSGFALQDPSDPRYQTVTALRLRFGKFLHNASLALLRQGDENTVDAVLMLIRACRTYLLDYGDALYSYYSQEDDYLQELGISRRYANQKLWPRAIFIRKARLYHAARMRWNALERTRTALEDAIIDDLIQWSLWQYATVRASAQSLVDSLTSVYDGMRRRCLPVLYTNVVKGSDDDRMKGALYTLNSSAFSKFAMGEPSLVPDLIEHLFECQWNEKPSIQDCVASVAESCISGFVEPCYLVYAFDYPDTARSVKQLRKLLPPLDDQLTERQRECRVNRIAMQSKAMDTTHDILLRFANDENTHWRYAITAIRLLRTLVRRDSGVSGPVMEYLLSQTYANHPSLRYVGLTLDYTSHILTEIRLQYAQRAVMKACRYIKLRTSTQSAEDLALYTNRNPLRRMLVTENPTHEYTATYLESFKAPLDRAVASEEPILQDKITSGWLVWKDDARFLLPDPVKSTFQPWDLESAAGVEAMRTMATTSEFWETLSSFYAEENHQEMTVMDNVSCVKSIFQLIEEECLPSAKPTIEKLIGDHDQNKQRAAAEMLAGLLSGSKHWPIEAQDRLWNWFTPFIDKILGSNVKTNTLSIWSSFLEYIFINRDPRRVQPLIQWLVQKGLSLEFNAESSFEPIKIAFFMRALIETLGWRFAAWTPAFLELYWKEIGGEHDEVLSYIADGLSAFCMIHWRPTPSQPVTEVFVRECATRPSRDDIMGIEHGYHMGPYLEFIARLPELRESRLPGARAPRSQYDRMLTTVIRWLYEGLAEVNATSMYQYILPLLPELFKAAELQDSDDLARRAHSLLVGLCGVTPPLPVVPRLLEAIFETIRTSPSWRIRSNTLPILQVLYFRQVPLISEAMVIKIQDVLSECLSDEVVEVREKAAETLSGILRCSPRRTILLLKDRFVRQAAKINLPRRNSSTYAANIRQLHAAILGITALIDAFPYSVPSWLPELIGDVLSRHTYDPIPISTTVRKCATKFKETHQDTWHEDSLKFNEEQLSALSTLLAGSSYYA
ncbi:hypothetical protein FRB99_005843 [Tulasnella sp. 403]|nr:hypothetical protein FRB99_005843 [Tulasnella sp. 403]